MHDTIPWSRYSIHLVTGNFVKNPRRIQRYNGWVRAPLQWLRSLGHTLRSCLKGAPAAFFWGYSSQWLIPMLAPNALYTSRNSRLQQKMRNQLELTR